MHLWDNYIESLGYGYGYGFSFDYGGGFGFEDDPRDVYGGGSDFSDSLGSNTNKFRPFRVKVLLKGVKIRELL